MLYVVNDGLRKAVFYDQPDYIATERVPSKRGARTRNVAL